ncbi:deSI-like protein At4g17486 isoform X1 [Phoenix dactylifera]|uniref:DeSI-like protein At4g17486 isoform X1 n=1 Tax=Phoenix dactylifera TaxID=42345 RepID=A0A8B7CGF2_PHODC|nr:deSI-like protein At4g17486 isoform X1 [Phoenix dactylifera]
MGCVFSSRSTSSDESGVPVVLNIYDLTPLNNYMYWFGLGIFHSGIEVHGLEYGFGAHDYPASGVFEVEPKNCPGFSYKCSISLGHVNMPPSEFRAFIENMAADYHGDTYHLISKNCNHFTDDVSLRLTGRPIPGWVNRLARLGTVCNCLLPESLRLPAAKQISEYHGFSEDVSESFSFITTTTHDLIESDDADQDKHLLSPSSDREVTSVKELDR